MSKTIADQLTVANNQEGKDKGLMIAIILASGTGSRLMPLTKDIPKSLVKVNGKTIIDIEIENILYCGINKLIITIGYKGGKLRNYVKEKYSNLDVIFVENEKYDSTNYIYSMWLTRNFIDDDILLLHLDGAGE
ncbi:NTP transferase domain-containing protein [bacterium]|nr:NTP transferase domain-containing protein [bacterium]